MNNSEQRSEGRIEGVGLLRFAAHPYPALRGLLIRPWLNAEFPAAPIDTIEIWGFTVSPDDAKLLGCIPPGGERLTSLPSPASLTASGTLPSPT